MTMRRADPVTEAPGLAPGTPAPEPGRFRQVLGHFCANVLTTRQRELARVFGTAGADKFAGVAWSPSASGAPILAGVLTWVACKVEAVHEAGDHHVVLGRVVELGPCRAEQPLLFYRGRYGVPDAASADAQPEVVDTLLAWPRHADWI